jgi:hypothetical protein
LDTVASGFDDYRSGSHCQAGQGGDVYTWFKANVQEVNQTNGGNKNRSIKQKGQRRVGKRPKQQKSQ